MMLSERIALALLLAAVAAAIAAALSAGCGRPKGVEAVEPSTALIDSLSCQPADSVSADTAKERQDTAKTHKRRKKTDKGKSRPARKQRRHREEIVS